MTPQLGEAWVYLAASPLLGLTMTLLAYQGATWLHRRSGGHPLANPVLLAVAVLVALLALTGTSYQTYFDGAQFVHFLLGPATVALAIPLYAQFDRLRRMALPLLGALLVGSLTAALSAVAIGGLLGASEATQLSLAPKSVTTPIAMGIAERIGGTKDRRRCRARLRTGHRLARHRHCPRLSGKRAGRRLCRAGDGPQRPDDRPAAAGGDALGDGIGRGLRDGVSAAGRATRKTQALQWAESAYDPRYRP